MMHNAAIFYPLLLQILLTITLYIALAISKKQAVKAGQVDDKRRGLYNDAWPENVQQINNCIRNQFELPVLFYVLVIVLYLLNAAGFLAQALAWLFAVSRLLHARIHTGSNHVPHRRPVFMFGSFMVMGLLVLSVIAVIQTHA